ncbi:leucine-rich repeat-containing protein 61 [Erythrolamprus reginae]|uniref:leucine-rich repeat-containing protein 61 n=1 Tax=Erythrolamprus reginae TaxID=121349 RepID=UPI00396CFA46
MDFRNEKSNDPDPNGKITVHFLKTRTGQFDLESILMLKLRGFGIVDLGCLGECTNLERLDLSGNGLTHLGPLATLKALLVLNVAANRISNLDPLAGCESLQSLDAAGNIIRNAQQLQSLTGLRNLDNLRFRNARARLSNPLCDAAAYPSVLVEMFPRVKIVDGERVSGPGSEVYQLCKDLDRSLQRRCDGTGLSETDRWAQPWVEGGYWEVQPPRRSSIMEEAYKQFNEALLECRELSKQAEQSIGQAERVLGVGRADANSYLF